MEYWNRLKLDPDPAGPLLRLHSERPTEKKHPEPTLTAISSVKQAVSTAQKNYLDLATTIAFITTHLNWWF